MPILHQCVEESAHYVWTKVKGGIVTFHLTAGGLERLQSVGVKAGMTFPRWLLLDLYRSGDVYTDNGRAQGIEAGILLPGEVDLPTDPDPETLFPSCSTCGSLDNLHLVEIRLDGPQLAILCPDCRTSRVERIDSSVPLPLVTRAMLSRLKEIKGIRKSDAAVRAHGELLERKFAKKWEALKRIKLAREWLVDGGIPEGTRL